MITGSFNTRIFHVLFLRSLFIRSAITHFLIKAKKKRSLEYFTG